MGLIIGTLGAALVVGWILGGRVSRLADLRIRWIPLAIAGFALQGVSAPGSWPLVLVGISFVLLIAFAGENVRSRLPGARLILVGVLLNFFVIAVNGGMPVTRSALERSNQMETLHALVADGGAKHHIATKDDRLLFLGDVVPLAPVHQIVSAGDAVTYLGVAWLVVAGMRPSRRRRPMLTPQTEGFGGVV
jgi:hypothetical protein